MSGSLSVEAGLQLSTEAGWNQTRADWERDLLLAPEGVFHVEEDGIAASVTIALVYDASLAWIGMVLTRKASRGKGYARTLLHRALEHCDARGVVTVKLDATDLGRPVYAKLGFLDERPVSRWRREPSGRMRTYARREFRMPAGDREVFGADRGALLRSLAEQETYGSGDGSYAFARPGRTAWHFGPCVAKSADAAAGLLAEFVECHGDEAAFVDLCDDNSQAVRIAREAGFAPVRHLVRMFRGRKSAAGWHPDIYALAGFEYG